MRLCVIQMIDLFFITGLTNTKKTKNKTPSFTLPYIPLLDLIFRYSLMKCYYLHGAKVSNYFDKVMTHLGHLLGGRWSEIMPCDGNIVGDCDRGDK